MSGPEMDRVYILEKDNREATILITTLTKSDGYGIGHLARESTDMDEINGRIKITKDHIWIEASKVIEKGTEIVVNKTDRITHENDPISGSEEMGCSTWPTTWNSSIKISTNTTLHWESNTKTNSNWNVLRADAMKRK